MGQARAAGAGLAGADLTDYNILLFINIIILIY